MATKVFIQYTESEQRRINMLFSNLTELEGHIESIEKAIARINAEAVNRHLESKNHPHNPKHVKMIDRSMIEKDNLRGILANLMAHIPGLPPLPEDQMNDPIFCAGLFAGIMVCLTSTHFPDKIIDPNFNVPILNIIDLMLEKHGEKMGIRSQSHRVDNDNKPN